MSQDLKFDFVVNPDQLQDVAVYTRHYGVATNNRVIGTTPTASNRIEFTVIDRQIVGWKRNGDLAIPQNGFVLSLMEDVLSADQLDHTLQQQRLQYQFTSPRYQGMKQAIQCGPLLIQNGQAMLTEATFTHEEFWISQVVDGDMVRGLVPTDYPIDIDETRAGACWHWGE